MIFVRREPRWLTPADIARVFSQTNPCAELVL